MENNDLSKRILDKVKMKVAISNFNEEERKDNMLNNKILKKVATFVLAIGVMSSVTYAGIKITEIFKIKGMDDRGIQTALENNYVQNINMDYIETGKVKFKVDYLMMDDVNFDLVFNFITEDKVDNYEGLAINNLLITDENGNQIFNDSEDQNIWTKNIGIAPMRWSLVEKNGNLLRQVFHVSSNNFPKSNKIFVIFDTITLYNVNKGEPITIQYEDNYKLEFDVSNQLIERKTIEYSVKDNSKVIENVKLTNSGLAVTINAKEYLKSGSIGSDNYTIIDELGKEYTLAQNLRLYSLEDMDMPEKLVLIFNMTSYDESNTLTLKSNDNIIYEFIKN